MIQNIFRHTYIYDIFSFWLPRFGLIAESIVRTIVTGVRWIVQLQRRTGNYCSKEELCDESKRSAKN